MIGHAIVFQSSNGATNYKINDRDDRPLLWQTTPYYYIAVTSAEGLHGAEISYESHPIPNAIGEKSGDVFRRGKSITLSGTIEALSLGYLEAGADYLGEMFAETAKRKLIWTRWNGVQVYYTARINNDLSITEEINTTQPRLNWIVGLRCDDPRSRRMDNGTVYPTWQQ